MRDVTALGGSSRILRSTTKDDFLWNQLAEAKWGSRVRQLAEKEGSARLGRWKEYCQHRMCLQDPRKSALNLIQEAYTDPWRHLVCCQLFSRTTAGPVVRATIASFLKIYTTPTSILEADKAEIEADMSTLGLQEVRQKALKRMSEGFLAQDWKLPSDLHGCGNFADDSWQIFCRGQTSSKGVQDRFLRQYLSWLKTGKQAAAGTDGSAKPTRPRKRKMELAPLTGRVLRSVNSQARSGPTRASKRLKQQ
ncbi:hypothetical protein WJX74_009316 [Apatococcus lobatus]|uniref:Uncharacterized protein n=1 Tax=Apatococcus lobatus TaxID=904363 RepID=A0AAW1S7P4_9CHLO